jgi:hypothetical protein
MTRKACWLALGLFVFAGCGSFREMTRPEAPLGGIVGAEKVTEASIRRAMEVKPQFTVPTKVAVVEVGTRQAGLEAADFYHYSRPENDPRGIVSLRPEEEKLWRETLTGERPAVAQVVPLAPLLVPAGEGDTMLRLRQAAARLGTDLLVVYIRESDWGEQPNAMSGLYLTIVGLWASPGTDLEAITVAKGAIVDVRNGFVYGVVSADDERKTIAAAAFVRKTKLDLIQRTEAKALAGLTAETGKLIDDLTDRLAAEARGRAAPATSP